MKRTKCLLVITTFILIALYSHAVFATEPSTSPQTGTVVVAKYTKTQDGGWYYVPEIDHQTFYVTAYKDNALTEPARNSVTGEIISGWMEVPCSLYYSNKNAVLEGLVVGETYYLAETTDATGSTVVVPDGMILSKIQFDVNGEVASNVNKLEVTVSAPNAIVPVRLTNVYARKGLTSATFQIKLNVVNENNNPLPSSLTASFEAHGNNNSSSGYSIGDGNSIRNIKLSSEQTKKLSNVVCRWNATLYPKLNIWAKMLSLKDASGADVMSDYSLVDPKNGYRVLASGTSISDYTAQQISIALSPEESNAQTLEYTLKKNAVVPNEVISSPEIISIYKSPSSLKAAVKKKKVTLSWRNVKKSKKNKALLNKIKSIEIQYATDRSFTDAKIKKVGKNRTKTTINLPKRNATFFFRIRFRSKDGGVSRWSGIKRVRTK